jgi:hypothetical protein
MIAIIGFFTVFRMSGLEKLGEVVLVEYKVLCWIWKARVGFCGVGFLKEEASVLL